MRPLALSSDFSFFLTSHLVCCRVFRTHLCSPLPGGLGPFLVPAQAVGSVLQLCLWLFSRSLSKLCPRFDPSVLWALKYLIARIWASPWCLSLLGGLYSNPYCSFTSLQEAVGNSGHSFLAKICPWSPSPKYILLTPARYNSPHPV